ncbi:hybrid sensor histidine kinase/response regulator, partial [Enterococcus hirae]
HIDLDVRTGAARVLVLGDPGELEQVLLILIVNARDAADGPGLHIVVETALVDGEVVLSVRDDGRGMPPEVAARAFEPFFSTK